MGSSSMRTGRRRVGRLLGATVVVGLSLLAACSGDGDDTSAGSASETTVDAGERCRADAAAEDSATKTAATFEATAESLSSHTAPEWWTDAKFGIFIHWGPYSVPAYAPPGKPYTGYAEWYWYYQQRDGTETNLHHLATYGPDVLYDDFIEEWKAERFDPDEWVDLFEKAGARYFVLTSKHHDGVALWPTQTTDRNTVAMGPERDLVGELFEAAECSELHSGLYYSIPEWYNPAPKPELEQVNPGEILFRLDDRPARNAYTGADVPYTGYRDIPDYATGQVIPQIRELIDDYAPEILWCDIGGPEDYYQSNVWIAEYYNAMADRRPDGVVVNDRCGQASTHRDFTTEEYSQVELTDSPQEVTQGMGFSFGYNAEEKESDYQTVDQLVDTLVDTVAKNGNYLLDIGPAADGTIPAVMVERLEGIGRWLDVNGDAIYGTSAWERAAEGDLRFTVGDDGTFYVTALTWPGPELRIESPVPVPGDAEIELLGSDAGPLEHRREGATLVVTTPADGATATGTPEAFVFAIRS